VIEEQSLITTLYELVENILRLRLVKAKINVIFFSQKITGKVSPGTRFCILAHIRAAKRDLKTEVVYTGSKFRQVCAREAGVAEWQARYKFFSGTCKLKRCPISP